MLVFSLELNKEVLTQGKDGAKCRISDQKGAGAGS